MANNFFPVITLTGGGVGALDNIDGNALAEGDAAFAVTGTLTRIYRLDATSGVTEDSPDIIAPDTNAGTKRWILVGVVTTSEEILKISKSDYATLLATSTNIVDVLLGTTRDDSDGGEWRLRCQDKSWFNETLNTATRGATRPFPEDFAIIAETDTVTIFDMTIPSCPMWMVFNTGVGTIIGSRTIAKAGMIQGLLTIPTTGGLVEFNFISDLDTLRNNNFLYVYSNNVSERNIAGYGFTSDASGAIINAACNDVTMTVLPDAPIDSETGIQVPTIAVFTDGGTSVIDGSAGVDTVKDSAITSAIHSGGFDSENRLFFTRSTVGTNRTYFASDYSTDSFVQDGYYSSKDDTVTVDPVMLSNTGQVIAGIASSGDLGLTLLKEDPVTPADGMVAYITSNYFSGWMVGDIELCLGGDSLTDRSVTGTTVTGTATFALINSGDLEATTATSDLTAPVTTGGECYGWEYISSVWEFRNNMSEWTGVSESGGTLTIVNGTVFTLLKYTNTVPILDQLTHIALTEKELFKEDALCTLNGSSDAVVAVKYDKRTDVLKVATGTDLTYFSGVKVIDGPTPSESTGTIVAIDILEEYNIVATDANTVLNKTILDLPIEHDVTPLFNVINVAKAGGDFTNLKDALDSITDNDSSHRYTIRIAPGIYEEDNPLQGKEYTTIKAMGDLQTTRITALNVSQDLITMSAYFTLEGLAFWGVTGATNYAVNQSVTGLTSLTRCLFGDCSNGVLLAHASASMTISDCGVFNPAETTLKGIYCTAGDLNINTFTGAVGTITTLLEVTGVNSIVAANHIRSTLSTLTTGISIKDSAQVDVNFAKLLNMATGIEVEDGIHVHIDGARIGDATVDGVRVNDVGTDVSLTMHSTIVKRSAGYDINVLSDTALVEGSISSTLNNINIVQGASVYGTILDLEEDDEGLNILGELHVGTPENPAESVFGEGDSYTRGLLAYTWDGSTYVDISTSVRSPSASSFTFPNTTVGTAIYLASDLTVGASPDYHQFFGVKMILSTAQIGGIIIGEYYNGSAWVEFSHMTSESGDTYYRKADELFLVDAGGYQIRFDPSMETDWAKTDNPSVDANDRYWIRFRITSSPSTLPIFEQFKLHSNRHEINNDGFGEDMGKARAYRTLPINWNTFKDAGSSVSNQDLWLSTNCKAGFANNAMSQGDSVGAVTSLPSWVDTSGHLRLQVSGIPVTTGNYTLTAYLNSSKNGDVISTSDPSSTTGEVSTSVLVACTANQQAWWTFHLDIHDKGVESLLSDPESIWINVETTTTAGNVYGLQFDLQFLTWRSGSHI